MEKHLTVDELEAGLENILRSPKDNGVLDMIVRRPQVEEREVLTEGKLDMVEGLEGDNWKTRGSTKTADNSAHPEMQINIMNSRVIDLVANGKDRWHLAGDQLFIDMDLSDENLPAGTKLSIGEAVLEVTPIPHSGCKKFTARFGLEAMKFVNSPLRKELHLRGINAKVVQAGSIRTGDTVKKI